MPFVCEAVTKLVLVFLSHCPSHLSSTAHLCHCVHHRWSCPGGNRHCCNHYSGCRGDGKQMNYSACSFTRMTNVEDHAILFRNFVITFEPCLFLRSLNLYVLLCHCVVEDVLSLQHCTCEECVGTSGTCRCSSFMSITFSSQRYKSEIMNSIMYICTVCTVCTYST